MYSGDQIDALEKSIAGIFGRSIPIALRFPTALPQPSGHSEPGGNINGKKIMLPGDDKLARQPAEIWCALECCFRIQKCACLLVRRQAGRHDLPRRYIIDKSIFSGVRVIEKLCVPSCPLW